MDNNFLKLLKTQIHRFRWYKYSENDIWHHIYKTAKNLISGESFKFQPENDITFIGTSVRLTYDFSTETMEVRRQWDGILLVERK